MTRKRTQKAKAIELTGAQFDRIFGRRPDVTRRIELGREVSHYSDCETTETGNPADCTCDTIEKRERA